MWGAGKVPKDPATRALTGFGGRRNDAAMSKPKPTKPGQSPTDTAAEPEAGVTWHGFLPDDDPRYRGGGWNFLMGKNLAPKSDKAGDE